MVFDWILLCHKHFFPRYYPDVWPILGPPLFEYNLKEHLTHMMLFIPDSQFMAWIVTKLW